MVLAAIRQRQFYLHTAPELLPLLDERFDRIRTGAIRDRATGGDMAFADLGDVQLFYTDEGTGDPPMLFVHGYTGDSHDWSWQLPHRPRTG